ncbi:SusD/RagB family nutrient-binding outer membrane lipoprotein [Terrimonas alba]|uniref:SusD/RagB family nutrient-binding outer membrane lipoprotein n=1 Tax=Terrimonas alba TaxID=3349636 RepID=UPI0035F343D8
MKKIILSISVILLIATTGCKKFIDVNDNPNVPIDVSEGLILSPVELDIAHTVSTGFDFAVVNHWMQNVALNQPVPNTGTYQLFHGDMDGDWANVYVTCLNNLQVLIKKAETTGNSNYAGIGKILTALALGTTTDLWGDVPFTEAFQGSAKFKPAYDKQEDVYKSIQDLLDKGIADINTNKGKSPGSDDFFYSGDLDKWKKLAYTLKARYYMHLTKALGHTAAAQADLALTALQNGMQSNDDDMKFGYPGTAGQENPIFVTFHPVSTLILSEHLVNGFKTRNDPRLSVMVRPAENTGLYNGRPIGSIDVGNLEDYSRPGSFYSDPASFLYVVNYTEALFLKAEATLIKSGFAAAQPVYLDAIKAHMDKLEISDAANSSYLVSRGVLTAGNALQLIIEEKTIANYLSIENFNDWRRTGFPAITKVPNALTDIPRRFLYPQSEMIANPQTIQSATLTDRVWWDKQ